MPPAPEPRFVRWLCGNGQDRARYADMYSRFARVYLFGALVGTAVLLAAVWFGWVLLVLHLLAMVTIAGSASLRPRARYPEVVGACGFVLLELNLAASVAVTGGVSSPLLPLVAVPVLGQAVCFRPRAILVGAALGAALTVLGCGAATALPPPPPAPDVLLLVSSLMVLACVVLLAHLLVSSDLLSRGEAMLDPLTGLHNRRLLESHLEEACRQAWLTGRPVSVVVCDLDHFKGVNDGHGHGRGDAVLRGFAALLREAVGEEGLVHRMGGEEFLVLLPGCGAGRAVRLAELVRARTDEGRVAGLHVTASLGVATAGPGHTDATRLVHEADTALYEAKRSGRNRVVCATRTP
ncbi:diguanylate cyclase (GGDEF)-like protein [Kineococcus xinjiangensis]|uniref:Diguanylate cyclase (GGDEF)-like protein n=1 Tax=Kineococcus xinjiangensis TaxID=512762 RepID=A0A2S6IFD5_9ACTN|nr:GGDEF domain-containing protein [Kineococcus xinjiangensis]PPK92932.1 diguanylate cyclase (GGDEF)-like protein [Kineococcus xinjiangensis]